MQRRGLKSLCGNLDFHSLYFPENRANRVAPTKLEIEKGCGNRFLALTTQALKRGIFAHHMNMLAGRAENITCP
jgi:hypothetical protein